MTPTTALFVASRPIGPATPFLDAAEADQPQLREAKAGVEAARQGVNLERSRERPWVYAFADYNLNRQDELVIEPDWIVGVGVHFTLLSNIDRRKSESAARQRERAAEATERQTRVDLSTSIVRAYDLVETSRRQFLELDSSIAAAAESLRVEELSFREGEATDDRSGRRPQRARPGEGAAGRGGLRVRSRPRGLAPRERRDGALPRLSP